MNDTSGTILIVDDEPVGRRLLEVLLAGQGYTLVTASSGLEALEKASALTPDVILLDVMMPDMDGFTVCRHLRDDPKMGEVPVVLVTALDDRESRLHGIDVGADDIITKPFDRDELRKRVQTIIRLDRYRRLMTEREQRQQQEEEIRRRNRELTLLNTVITTAAAMLDRDAIMGLACEALVQALEVDLALGLLINEERTHVTVVAEHRTPRLRNASRSWTSLIEHIIPLGMLPALEELLTHKTLTEVSTAQTDPRFSRSHKWFQSGRIETLILIPVPVREQVAGAIVLGTPGECHLTSYDRALIESIAVAVGQPMEIAQLYQRLHQYADHLQDLVRKRTQELQSERDRTHAILEALGEAVIVTDCAGRIQYANPAATLLTGYSHDELLGQAWLAWQAQDQQYGLSPQVLEYVRAGNTWRGELLQHRKDGTRYDAAITVAPFFDLNQPEVLVGIVSVQRDITPLREAERLKNQFVSNVSHELRTPLSIITLLSGNLDTLFDRIDTTRQKKIVRDIREHTKVLNELISDILEISRIDSLSLSVRYQPVNLAQLVQEEAERQLPLAHKRGQYLTVNVAEQLIVQGNDGQIRQVIRNLLNNAIKYTPPEGQIICECRELAGTSTLNGVIADAYRFYVPSTADHLQVWPGSDWLPSGCWAAFRVVDTGMGIGPEDLPHIFERFYRVHTESNIPGTGLGLSIAQELVKLHNGHIALASLLEKGTVVAFYLPLIKELPV